MKLTQKFKKAGYGVAALAMVVTVGVSLSQGSAYAACEGPADLGELQALLNERNNNQNITLCGDIEGQFIVYRRMTTINLNGYSISSGDEAFARVREQGRLTITGDGEVNGRLSHSLSTSSFYAAGGTFSADVTNFAANGYAAYNVDGVYLVEPQITNANFEVTPADDITIRRGETAKIEVTLPEGSTSGVSFTTDTDGVIEIDAEGNIVTVGTGYTYVTVSSTYDPSITKGLYVNVYDVEPTVASDDEQYGGEVEAAENLKGLIDGGLVDENGDANDAAKTAFGEVDTQYTVNELQDAMYFGEVINTQIYKEEASLTDTQRTEMAALMTGVSMDNIKYYEVDVDVYRGANYIGSLHEMENPVHVFIAEVTEPEEGFTRKYYMVSYHNGEPELLEEGVDFEIKDGKVYLISSKFSVFALGYKDIFTPVVKAAVTTPDTGTNTSVENNSAVDSNIAAVLAAISAIVMAGAVKFAKRK